MAAPNVLGPYDVPTTYEDAEKLFVKLRETPRGAVAAFLIALCRRTTDAELGDQMLSIALHPDCLHEDGRVRVYTARVVDRIDSQILASLLLGDEPQLTLGAGVTFQFDSADDGAATGEAKEGSSTRVWLVTSGPPPSYPQTRSVDLRFTGGQWGVRTFLNLTTAHKLPEPSPGEDEYRNYPGHPGYHPIEKTNAPPQGDGRPHSARSRPETPEERVERQEKAKRGVEELAAKLAAKETGKKAD